MNLRLSVILKPGALYIIARESGALRAILIKQRGRNANNCSCEEKNNRYIINKIRGKSGILIISSHYITYCCIS